MEQLIKITEQNGKQAVSARELHEFLEVKTQFTKWCERMFEYDFVENQDFVALSQKRLTAQGNETTLTDYALTLDCAKEIAMLQRTDKGKQARQYFIACEKALKAAPALAPIALEDAIIQTLQFTKNLRLEQDKIKAKQVEHEDRILQIEAKTATRPDYFTVMGFAITKNLRVGLSLAIQIGKKAKAMCVANGYHIEKVHDPRFGHVGCYPTEVLQEVFRTTPIN